MCDVQSPTIDAYTVLQITNATYYNYCSRLVCMYVLLVHAPCCNQGSWKHWTQQHAERSFFLFMKHVASIYG